MYGMIEICSKEVSDQILGGTKCPREYHLYSNIKLCSRLSLQDLVVTLANICCDLNRPLGPVTILHRLWNHFHKHCSPWRLYIDLFPLHPFPPFQLNLVPVMVEHPCRLTLQVYLAEAPIRTLPSGLPIPTLVIHLHSYLTELLPFQSQIHFSVQGSDQASTDALSFGLQNLSTTLLSSYSWHKREEVKFFPPPCAWDPRVSLCWHSCSKLDPHPFLPRWLSKTEAPLVI